MQYQEYTPSPLLAPFVKCYWTLESDEPGPKNRIFPDGSIELIFHYGDHFRKYNPDGSIDSQSLSFVHGQLRSYIEVEATGAIGMFSVRFTPGGLQPFIDFGVDELTDRRVDTQEVWPVEGEQLVAEMYNAGTTENRIRIIERFFLERKATSTADFPTTLFCVDAILEDPSVSIEELAARLNIGRRSLERKFISGVGLSPRFLARIIRFNKTLQLIADNDFSTFTSVAHESGFYDQAHFIKDFKEFTGLNPRQYFSENHELVQFFNL